MVYSLTLALTQIQSNTQTNRETIPFHIGTPYNQTECKRRRILRKKRTATKIELSSLQMRIMNAKNVNLRTYFEDKERMANRENIKKRIG